jgi:hypothetical protein
MSAILSIETKKKLIEANCRLEDLDETPFLIEIGEFHGATKDFFDDPAAEIQWNERYHRNREKIYDYCFPNIKTNQGIGTLAAAFGCEYIVNNEADPWITPLIKEDNIEDVHSLKIPDMANNPVLQKALDRIDYLQSHSALPLRMVNVASPLVTASLIWEYTSFVESTLECPEEVHVLLEKVTEATILFIKEQFRRITNLYNVGHEIWYLPRSSGVRVSDDTAALLSPNLYREFGVKYNAKIAEAFGGIVVHSCGDVSNVAPVMMEIPGLKGLDFTIPQVSNWEAVKKACAGKTALYLRHFYWDHIQDAGADLPEYTRKLIDFFGRKGVFIQTSAPTPEEAVVLGEKLQRILSR